MYRLWTASYSKAFFRYLFLVHWQSGKRKKVPKRSIFKMQAKKKSSVFEIHKIHLSYLLHPRSYVASYILQNITLMWNVTISPNIGVLPYIQKPYKFISLKGIFGACDQRSGTEEVYFWFKQVTSQIMNFMAINLIVWWFSWNNELWPCAKN